MTTPQLDPAPATRVPASDPLCPFDLRVSPIARFLNGELVDDPVYDGFELQYFDDAEHGTGLLAFLSRRADRRVDYYPEPGLRLDRESFSIGGGTGTWTETVFDAGRLDVDAHGVEAEVRFRDIDGRLVELTVSGRTPHKRRGVLLAPVSSAIDHPKALLLVVLDGFDLVRPTGSPPLIRIDGRDADIGTLPGRFLHRRALIKYAAPLCAVELTRNRSGALPRAAAVEHGAVAVGAGGITGLRAQAGGDEAALSFTPAFPDLEALPDGAARAGTWSIAVNSAAITGGTWAAAREGDEVALALDVTERWRPGPLPALMRIVTTVVPVFRRWPTTYRWRATVTLGDDPAIVGAWERTGNDLADSYRRATQR